VQPRQPDRRLDQIPGAHPDQGPLRMLRRWLLLGKPRTNGPWRWTTSCPETRAARTTSATCRPSASAAMPASDGRRETGCVFCALEASGRVLLENALETVRRRCLPRERGAQPGDSSSPWGRRAGAAPAGVERCGGAGSFDREEMRSAGGNLMPSDNNVGLNLKHPIYHVRVTTLVDQLDG